MSNPSQSPADASVSNTSQPADARLAKRIFLAVVCCAAAAPALLVFGVYQSLTYYYGKPLPNYLIVCQVLIPVFALSAEVLGGLYFVKARNLPDTEARVWMGVAVWVSMIVAAIPLGLMIFSLASAFFYVTSPGPTVLPP